MSCWGTELWDQFDSIVKYEDRCAGFCEIVENFVKERTFIEEEYAKALRRLIKSVQSSIPIDLPKVGSSQNGTTTISGSGSLPVNSNVRSSFISAAGANNGAIIYGTMKHQPLTDNFNCMSFMAAFAQIIREHQDIASQHELIAENVRSGVLAKVQDLVKDIREQKRRSTEVYKERKRELEKQLEFMNKSLRRYEQAFQVCSKATEAYERANEDINLSRAQVEKNRMAMNRRNTECEQVRIEYNGQVEKFNEAKNAFYREDIVRLFGELEEFNTVKINQLKDAFEVFIESHSQVVPRIQECLRQMDEAVATINPDVDSVTLMENLKTGYPYPSDQTPVDLKNDRPLKLTPESVGLFGRKASTQSAITLPVASATVANGSTSSFTSKSNTIRRMKKMINSRKKSSQVTTTIEPFNVNPNDFDHLPPAQRLKRYQAALDDLNRQIETKQREREALAKMQTIYTENPRFGETEQVDEKLHQTDLNIVTLSNHAKKFENLISIITKKPPTDNPEPISDPPEVRGPEIEEQPKPIKNVFVQSEFIAPNPPPPVVEQVTVVGSATTQYAFDAVHHAAVTKGTKNPVNMLSFEALEEMDLLEPDLGDGWIKVLRRTTGEIGFVPSSYCKIHMFDRIVVDFD